MGISINLQPITTFIQKWNNLVQLNKEMISYSGDITFDIKDKAAFSVGYDEASSF